MTALQPSTDETTTAQATEPTGDIQSSVREDLLSYAELGGFTLTAKTHAWYAAADTIANPEEARAASTVLAELRGRDLPATRETAARLLAETTLGELKTAAALNEAVTLLHRIRTTLATLSPAIYASDALESFTAATADGRWRKEHGVKLSWGQRRALRRDVRAFAVTPGTRRAALHAALTAAALDRKEWAALAPGDARPALPTDEAILDGAIQAIEAAQTGLRELDRLLPEYDLATMPFEELSDLVDQLAADEGTLYRLPTLRALRDGIEQRGHGALLAELTDQRADAEAVAAACDQHFPARTDTLQSLLPNPREDADTATAAPTADEPEAEAAAESVVDTEAATETEALAEAEAEAVAEPEVEVEAAAAVAEVEDESTVDAEAAEEAAAEVEAEAAVEAEAETTPGAELDTADEAEAEPEAIVEAEVEAETVAEVEVEAEAAAEAAVELDNETVAEAEAIVEAAAAVAEDAPEVDAPAEEATAEPVVETAPAASPGRPDFTPGRPVNAYSADELLAVVRWIDADGSERSEDELLRAAMKELGFSRLGPRIKEALGGAVSAARG